jgi:chromate transporter
VGAILLMGLPAIAPMMGARWLTLMSVFFRTGALTFGGGHVILPLAADDCCHSGLGTQ